MYTDTDSLDQDQTALISCKKKWEQTPFLCFLQLLRNIYFKNYLAGNYVHFIAQTLMAFLLLRYHKLSISILYIIWCH